MKRGTVSHRVNCFQKISGIRVLVQVAEGANGKCGGLDMPWFAGMMMCDSQDLIFRTMAEELVLL